MSARTPAEILAIGMKSAVEYGDCLEWTGLFTNRNNTQPSIKARLPGKDHSDNVSVPRLLWEINRGPIPKGMMVYRKCSNYACVCLDHLALGTRRDLMAARRKNGKLQHTAKTVIAITLSARRRPTTKYTEADVRKVRELLGAGEKRNQVVELTGVSKAMVDDIAAGRAWRDLSNPWAGLTA
jgi:hypothetical protein